MSRATRDESKAGAGTETARARDLDLVRRVLEGEALALEGLRARLARLPAMVRHQDAKLGRMLNETELEDVVRDTVVALWAKLGTFEGRSTFDTWMYRFAGLELLKAVQRKCRAPEPLEDPWSAPDRSEACEPEPEPAFSRAELESALDRLTPAAAQAIRERHFEGLAFERIAERAGLPLNTVKARYYRGLARLREILDRELRKEGA